MIDSGMKGHLRAILALGESVGNRLNFFSKVGDSITLSPSFLSMIGLPGYDPTSPVFVGTHVDLAKTINYFRSSPVDPNGGNSFTHISLAAHGGWDSDYVLNPGENALFGPVPSYLPTETPLAREIHQTNPAIALIMLGTGDLGNVH